MSQGSEYTNDGGFEKNDIAVPLMELLSVTTQITRKPTFSRAFTVF